MRSFLLIVLAGGTLGVGCHPDDAGAAPDAVAAAAISDSLLIEVPDAERLVDHLLESDHEVTILNFWATWCTPCREEFPLLIAYDAEHEADGVEVRFVATDEATELPEVRAFLGEQGLDEVSYFSPGNDTMPAQFNPMLGFGLPTTLVLDADGILRDSYTGLISRDRLDEMVATARTPRG